MTEHVPKPGTVSFIHHLSEAWIADGVAGLARAGGWTHRTAGSKLYRLRQKHGLAKFPHRRAPGHVPWLERAIQLCDECSGNAVLELKALLIKQNVQRLKNHPPRKKKEGERVIT